MKFKVTLVWFTAILLLFANVSLAQTDDSKREKIDALRAAFINKKVNFTPLESQQFWPLYNEMNDKLDAARKAFTLQYNAKTNYDFATDKEAEAYLNAELNRKQKEYEITREYYEKFKKIMPVKKVAAVKRAEEDWKQELIKIIKGGGA